MILKESVIIYFSPVTIVLSMVEMNIPGTSHDIGTQHIVTGIKRLGRASLLFAITSVLLSFSQLLSSDFIAQVFVFINEMYEGVIVQEEIAEKLVTLIKDKAMNLLISGIVLVASFILSLLSLFKYGLPGFSDLKEWRPRDFNLCASLFKAGSIGGLISLTLAIALLIHVLFIIYTTFTLSEQGFVEMAFSGILFVVGNLLVLLGSFGALIAFFKLGRISGIKLFYVAGVLLITTTLLFVLTARYDTALVAIAWISAYAAFRTLRKDYSKIQIEEDSSPPFT